MVDDRVTDGKRVAQLLASELSGRETGPLADVSVVDADPDAEPGPEGTRAYGVAVRGDRVATVRMYPDAAVVEVTAVPNGGGTVDGVTARARDAGLSVGTDEETGTVLVRVESGAQVKRAMDALVDELV